MMMTIGLAAGVMLALALFMTTILGWANKALHVEVDVRIEKINEALPGANCGGCGFIGCGDYAEAVVEAGAAVTLCPVGGSALADEIAGIMGVTIEESYPYRPVVHCVAHYSDKLGKHHYDSETTCTAANLVGGVQGCTYGCLAFGDCVTSCKFDAIHVVDGKVEVDYDKCVGCGACDTICPRNVIHMVPFKASKMWVVACSNADFGKDVKAVCKAGCMGCKLCEKFAEGIFEMEGHVAKINYENYEPETVEEAMELVIKKCPTKAIVEVGNPTEADLEAVKDEELPSVITADFETTVDKTEWQG
ncbi:MAG: RnfABCDGE type electron transport complex subunit B [Phycisphaerales bacterium]|jgi:Na+-translocating ferredoxin:NAD+ oxidoreductase subunit B|nr:RnfABCDGE type electron transport complex subunit B [Phycisphaerales bacterium]